MSSETAFERKMTGVQKRYTNFFNKNKNQKQNGGESGTPAAGGEINILDGPDNLPPPPTF
jgi:hypothetical protein